jgi:Leucine-rich repeat (LRR) protein
MSFTGLKLPNSLRDFKCSNNRITSYFVDDGLTGLKLPPSLKEFRCYSNQITNFAGLMLLPNSLIYFDCRNNHIMSFSELVLPNSLDFFDCSHNRITSFSELILPDTVRSFDFNNNHIEIIENFVFPSHLKYLTPNLEVKFINPKFNSVLEKRFRNKVKLSDEVELTDDELIFLYLNLRMNYRQYEFLIELL